MDLTDLNRFGAARLPNLLTSDQCADLVERWSTADGLGEEVVQPRDSWGGGSYRMFNLPLPDFMADLQDELYPRIAEILNGWAAQLGEKPKFPERYAELLIQRGPGRRTGPTPVLTVRETGDWNVMHRDPAHAFPLQVAILLSESEIDFTGGHFVLNEQWAHMSSMQARPEIVPLCKGDAVIFPVHERVAIGADGPQRVGMYHGMTRLLSGKRYMLGLLF